MDDLWNEYENALSQLRSMEMKNRQLENNGSIDMMRIKFLNNEEDAKIKDREECSKRISDLNNFYTLLSKKLDELEEKLDYDNVSDAQIKELNTFYRATKNTNRILLNVEISRQRRQEPIQHSTS